MSFTDRRNNLENGSKCNCVGKHVPLPLTLYYIGHLTDTEMYLCPTAYENFLAWQAERRKYQGRPPGSVRKHFSDFIQNLI
jgi:hypothetical protein